MDRKPNKKQKGIFNKGMTWRVIYQGVMIGILTLVAFIAGLGTKNVPYIEGMSTEQVKVAIAQTMAFTVLGLSELVHIFNVRNNKKSIFKTGIFNNSKLFMAIAFSAGLMFIVMGIPSLKEIFRIVSLPVENILICAGLIFSPILVVELFKLLKINTSKDE